MSNVFETYADDLVEDVSQNIEPVEPVDAIEFLTSTSYMSEDPTPFQRVVIKTFYNLWELYPPDKEELALIKLEKELWGIDIPLRREDPLTTLVLVLGRRGTKSTSISYIATYGMYTLICRGNPQQYYGIRERHRIHITHVASAGDQAEEVFSMTSDNIRKVPFFLPYIDFDKNNSTELRLFSPHDLMINKRIRQRNSMIARGSGMMKEATLPGSLYVESITTSAASARGRAIYLLLLSELAHFQRGKIGGVRGEDQIIIENKQSDYAIVKALSPSVKDFGTDGKILMESSPMEKGGEFYFHYCIAGGKEQEHPEEVVPEKGYGVLQFATWEARPVISRESLEPEFRKDPVGAAMEFGAHFGNPSGAFISESLIHRAVTDVPMIRTNPGNWRWYITLDPGGKAKAKKADTYALAWGHVEGNNPDTCVYWVNGMHGWDAVLKPLPGGVIETIPVDPNAVVAFVIELVNDLGGKNFVLEIAYDQFDSSAPVATLQSRGYPAIETTFTNPYKSSMYGNCLQMLEANRLKVYSGDTGGYVDRWKLEMKHLQRIISGKYTYYQHPSSGPVQTDDFADVVANLVHRMCLRTTPTKQSVLDARKYGLAPTRVRRTIAPIKGPAIWKGR